MDSRSARRHRDRVHSSRDDWIGFRHAEFAVQGYVVNDAWIEIRVPGRLAIVLVGVHLGS